MNKHISIFVLVLIVVGTFVSCTDDTVVLLDKAETFLPAKPDSALDCLNQIGKPEKLGEAQRVRYGLLRTIVSNRQGVGIKDDSIIRPAYDFYRKATRKAARSDTMLWRHYAQSCYYMSLYYASCDSPKQCEDLLRQSVLVSRRYKDWHTCYLAYTLLGTQTCWSNPEYAIRMSLEALHIYHKINDDVNNEVLILGHIGSCYETISDFEQALTFYLRAYTLAKHHHLKGSRGQMFTCIINTYLYKGEFRAALKCLLQGTEDDFADQSILAPLTSAKVYQACDSLEKAKGILSPLKNTPDLTNRYFVYRGLSQILAQESALDSLPAYIDSAFECLENRFIQLQQVKGEYYQSNIIKEKQQEVLQRKAERIKWLLGILTISTLLIFIVAKNKLKAERQKRKNAILHQRLENAIYRQKQQEDERIIAEHEKILQYQNEIIRQKALMLSVMQKHLLGKLEQTAKAMSDSERIKMTEAAWTEIEHLIDDTDNNFVQNLRKAHKDFKEEDIQLCMLTRIKMSNQTIANIYNIGISAVKKRKLALKKTGFFVTDPAISLEQVIERL